jgi:hypothetical protein
MRAPSPAVLAISSLLTGIASILTGDDFKLPSNCTLPFKNIATQPDPYLHCGNDGSGTNGAKADQAKVLEDNAKNNFCAGMSDVTTVDFNILKQMQANSPPKPPLATSRDSLHGFFSPDPKAPNKKIGEGSVVRLLAFIKEAHISDCDAGEEVNCKTKGFPNNDIHIPLVDPTQTNPQNLPECTSVTAEMSPHFRPSKWSEIDLKTPVMNPVRMTGPLFYDDSHEPCQMKNGKLTGPGPQRISLWEIHPLYAIDVCVSADPKNCDVNSNDSKTWMPYDKWVDQNPSKVKATGQKQRESCGGGTR